MQMITEAQYKKLLSELTAKMDYPSQYGFNESPHLITGEIWDKILREGFSVVKISESKFNCKLY